MPGEQQGGKGNGGNGKGKGNGGQHQANGGNGGGGPAVPPPANPPPAAAAEVPVPGAPLQAGQGGQQEWSRGLDSGLAKAAPSAVGLTQTTYRSFRRRLDLFGRQCLRRGNATAVEGAYLVLSQLQDVAWDESIDYDDIELNEDPFKPIVEVLDKLFQHEEEVELLRRSTVAQRTRIPTCHNRPLATLASVSNDVVCIKGLA